LNHLVGTEKDQVGHKWGKSGADDEDELPFYHICVLCSCSMTIIKNSLVIRDKMWLLVLIKEGQ